MNGHRTAELRSLELHRLVAARISRDGDVVRRARLRVGEWEQSRTVHPAYCSRWLTLLDGPADELLQMLIADTHEASGLRQVTPFAGVISPAERWRILREVS